MRIKAGEDHRTAPVTWKRHRLLHASVVSRSLKLSFSSPDAVFSDNWAVKMGRTGIASTYEHVLPCPVSIGAGS